MPYEPPDFFAIEELLTEDERMIRDAVRSWVTDRLLPVVADHYMAGTFPTDLIPEMAEMGLLGASIEGYGCPGLGPVAYGLILQELERGDSGIRSFVSVQGSLVMWPISAFGSDEQKQRWLPALHKGEAIGCFGLTEPDHGSDPGGMETKAVKTGDGYVLNGTKMWITNASMADVALVWAKLDGTIHGFLVEKGLRGFSAQQMKRKYSLRASDTSELILQDVKVPASALMPGASGLKGPLSCLSQARGGIAWGACGAAMACYDEARQYSLEREVQGGVLASKQLTQEKLVYMFTEITKAQLLALRVAQLKDEGRLEPVMVSMIKRNNVDIALNIARIARDLLGANGIVDDYQAMRHMVNLETVRTYEGTHDVHTLILGEHITGFRAI